MVGIWTFDASNNVLTVVGGSSGSPAGFMDAWNADKAGTRTLKAATASPFTASLDTAVKPADSLALRLSVVITNFSVAGTVTLTGKDAWGNAISEVLNVTANSTVVSTLYYASIDANGVVAAGTFTAAITQPRWGVVWLQTNTGLNVQFTLDALLQVGDGTIVTYFADSNKDVVFSASVGGSYAAPLIRVTSNCVVTFGVLRDSEKKVCDSGVRVTSFVDNLDTVILGGASGVVANSSVYLYSCTFLATVSGKDHHVGGFLNGRIWFCTFNGMTDIWLTGTGVDVFEVNILRPHYGMYYPLGYFNSLRIYGSTYAAIFSSYSYDITVYNAKVRGSSLYEVALRNSVVDLKLVNPDFDNWRLTWSGTCTNKVVRQYEFDLTTAPNATVTLKKADGSTVFSVVADAVTGTIATQTVSRGFYDYAHGDTLQDYGPFTLTITKTGKMPYTQTGIVLYEKTRLLVALRDQLTGTATAANVAAGATFYKDDADAKQVGSHVSPVVLFDVASGKPVLNLNNKKLDNQLVLGL